MKPKSKSSPAAGSSTVAPIIRIIAFLELFAGIALLAIGFNNLDRHPELIASGVAALIGTPFLFAVAEILVRLAEISANTKNLASLQAAGMIKRADHPAF
ncbi:hypothetical protein [Haloferula sp. BvORR071]|uniref:hypothetical protein n=1 Tax=Haloferula sp. BvORR071 TaxID=1396141 RepID=UPI0005529A35|nr:hypothetical protein [Haloferula sp. BvORR071]